MCEIVVLLVCIAQACDASVVFVPRPSLQDDLSVARLPEAMFSSAVSKVYDRVLSDPGQVRETGWRSGSSAV
jgi:hypothetical protein